MRTIRRLTVILLAYTAGCFGAGLLVAATLGAFAEGVGLGTSVAVGSYTWAFALPLVAAAVVAGEVFRWQSILIWVAVGGAVGAFALLVLGEFTPGISEDQPYLFLAAGCIWGVVYWLIAGRHAGEHRQT